MDDEQTNHRSSGRYPMVYRVDLVPGLGAVVMMLKTIRDVGIIATLAIAMGLGVTATLWLVYRLVPGAPEPNPLARALADTRRELADRQSKLRLLEDSVNVLERKLMIQEVLASSSAKLCSATVELVRLRQRR